jgi:hypothetical protein
MNAYTPTNFVEGSAPGVSAVEMNKISQGITNVTTEVIAHEADNVKHITATERQSWNNISKITSMGGMF